VGFGHGNTNQALASACSGSVTAATGEDSASYHKYQQYREQFLHNFSSIIKRIICFIYYNKFFNFYKGFLNFFLIFSASLISAFF
jgi:hypothetical protein